MLCKNPYMAVSGPVSCGQCMPCRFNRRRLWTHRLMLESLTHKENCFVTLTYNNDHHPIDGSLDPRHLQLWIKRLRKRLHPTRVRYYAVGEYGDDTQRPHYHLALFGVGYGCKQALEETWEKGFVMVGDLNFKSAQYIAGYVTKKMTKKDDPRLNGRHPEFARMSNRPGIGALAMEVIASSMITKDGEILGLDDDVPEHLRHGGKKWPLGRYLKRRLRKELRTDEDTPKSTLQRWKAEVSSLREDFLDNSSHEKAVNFKEFILGLNLQKVRNFESKAKIYNQRRSL